MNSQPSIFFPSISVVIPAYNAAATIADAVRSTLAQTYRGSVEVIVINDGSPDTAELETAMKPFGTRINYIRQNNRGPSLARNAGIVMASGTWIAFLDADDYWYPRALEVLWEKASGGVDMVYGNADLAGRWFKPGAKYTDWSPSDGAVTPEAFLSERCSVLTSSVLVKREVVLQAGMFDPATDGAEDFDLWLRIAMSGNAITYTSDVVVCRRYTDQSLSADRKAMLRATRTACQKVAYRRDVQGQVKSLASERSAQLRREYWKYAVRQSSVLQKLRHNPLWCYCRHNAIDGYCPDCRRQWNSLRLFSQLQS